MRTTLPRAGLALGSWLAALGAAAPCAAGVLEVSVVDEQGRPIQNVAVYAKAVGASGERAAMDHAAPKAIMDQHDHKFVPHVLVVQAGTEITFPNSDDVSHHVYSFSEAKRFELPLYKGDVYPPVLFDRPGVVVVGCNIHDGMLGYIRVVDTPHFARTNEQGVAVIGGVPSGQYLVEAWTPRARPAGLPPAAQIAVTEESAALELRVTGRLAPAHEHPESSLTWERY